MEWVLRHQSEEPLPDFLPDWAEELCITEHLAAFLWRRGLHDKASMQFFINPSLQKLAPLEQWPGLLEAAEVLVNALLDGKRLCVWGDYDVDGITGTALVLEFLKDHGFSCDHYIPNRLEHGYGLNADALSSLAQNGVQVLVTVDSGISDNDAIAHAKNLGMTVVVSDHHLPAEVLPPADAIVNPRLAPCPCPALAGVGVAFLLMAAVNTLLEQKGRPKQDIRKLLDLVALGTLADVVDLQGQNRILVKNGLLLIASGRRPGIAALKMACNHASTASLGAGQVVFALAPRINAAGRLGSSESALELLLTQDRRRAAELATELSRLNAERREEEDRILAAAKVQAAEQVVAGRFGLVLYNSEWHPGIIGIVASRLVEEHHRPVVVLSLHDTHLKGSGRSVSGCDIHDAFSRCAEFLLGFGGHKMAAGLSLLPEHLGAFQDAFDAVVGEMLGKSPRTPVCRLDGELSFSVAADFTFLKELELLQPFGMGNAEPVFSSPPVKVRGMRGKAGFMLLDLVDEKSGLALQAKAWRQAADIPFSLKGKYITIAYTPRLDRYSSVPAVELRLKDWKEA